MAKVRQTGTEAELALRRELFRRGLRYRVSFQVLKKPRRVADIAFPSLRVAVFVDGCFWHGCPKHVTWPKQNPEYWRNKIETNRARDADTVAKLQAAGWRVVRVWAHESPTDVAAAISLLVVRIKEMQTKSRSDSVKQR